MTRRCSDAGVGTSAWATVGQLRLGAACWGGATTASPSVVHLGWVFRAFQFRAGRVQRLGLGRSG